jgi:hypothetical protein
LTPRLCAGQVYFGFGLCVGGTRASRRAHRDYNVMHSLRTATVLNEVELRFFRCGFG